MEAIERVDTETLLSGQPDWMGVALLSELARHPLECLDQEFPHFVYSVDGADGFERPSERHPVFYGCFDWHSAVHSHWCLIRQLRLFEDHPAATDIIERIGDRLTPENVAQEADYLEANETFERPYGWAWLLRLVAELALWSADIADDWRRILAPLESQVVDLVQEAFLTQERPFRVGTHGNSAFALQAVIDYARVTGNESLETEATTTAKEFYLTDREYPLAYEPLGWDFLSPGLTEADLMRRVLDREAFVAWFEAFLPDVAQPPAESIFEPETMSPAGGVELHIVGLNLSRAWSLAGLADLLDGHRHAEAFRQSAARHARRGIESAFTEDYAGAHWLSSFVLYLLSRKAGGIAPT